LDLLVTGTSFYLVEISWKMNDFSVPNHMDFDCGLIFALLMRRFALVGADATSARSILVFKHDYDKVFSVSMGWCHV
jgi:hypothetical protein